MRPRCGLKGMIGVVWADTIACWCYPVIILSEEHPRIFLVSGGLSISWNEKKFGTNL